MRKWRRSAPMQTMPGEPLIEKWSSENADGQDVREYSVRVTPGKPVDVLSLKFDAFQEFKSKIDRARSSRNSLFSSLAQESVKACPVCDAPSSQSRYAVTIDNALYHECIECNHRYLLHRPDPKSLDRSYTKDVRLLVTQEDKRTSETRVRQTAMPKVKWAVRKFEELYRRSPKRILDVGADGGHFVHACRLLGYDAVGVEGNDSCRAYCRERFGFDLLSMDFKKHWESLPEADLITFWGTLALLPEPKEYLQAARKHLQNNPGLVIAEVPRWNSLGTAVQIEFPNTVVRHLDPISHLNLFTDNSIATMFEQCEFAPTAAWYFGLDSFELITQIAYRLGDNVVFEILGKLIPTLQQFVDVAHFSDQIVLAGKSFLSASRPLESLPTEQQTEETLETLETLETSETVENT